MKNWMKYWMQSLKKFVSIGDRSYRNPFFVKGRKFRKKCFYPMQSSFQWFLPSFLLLVVVSGCSKVFVDSGKTLTSEPSLTNCRMVQHAMGETCVPHNPKRLITISEWTLANALTLGIKPIGSTTFYAGEFHHSGFPLYAKNMTEGLEPVGDQI